MHPVCDGAPCLPVGIDVELIDRGALGAQRAFVVGAARIAFDVDDPVAFDLHERRTTDGAEWANTGDRLRIADAELLRLGASRRERRAEADESTDRRAGTRAGGHS